MQVPNSKEELLENLEKLIEITYKIEKEFIELKNILNGVIEFLPQALWVVDKDNEIIVKNSKTNIFNSIPSIGEIEVKNRVFLVQKSTIKDKTIISATDITEQKRNERLISMGQMAAHLAHEIRNPIGSVSILLSLLKKQCPYNDLIEEIRSAIFRVERIIKSTLLFSKGIKPKKKKFLLAELEKELRNSIKYYSFSKDIKFLFFLPDVEIFADFDLIMLVLQNMIFNGIDAIEEDEIEQGIIEVLYEEDEKYHIVNVYDNAKEFENKDILFEPFKSSKSKGHGLGLTLSLEIVKAHNGKIELATKRKGFKIYLPKS